MIVKEEPSKQARREFERWRTVLRRREAGLSVAELAQLMEITESQIYALLKAAKAARARGWL